MLTSLTGNAIAIIAALVFIASMLLFEGLYLMWASYRGPRAQRVKRRLRYNEVDAEVRARLHKQRQLSELPLLERTLLRMPHARNLERYIVQAGLRWSVARLLLLCFALGLVCLYALADLVRLPLLPALVMSVPAFVAPLLYVRRSRSRRLRKIEQQLPDALDLMTRALRSGNAFASGLQMVGDEMADPIAGEFRVVHDEINFGVSLQQALTSLTERVPSTDLRYFVVSVLIQRESGGNLTEVLGNLSRLIRERLKLIARVRVLSAEGRLSAQVLVVMPFALAGVMNLVNHEFMSPLWTDPIGVTILKYMLTLMAIGVLLLHKITRLRY
jgi:tight adherence protein B